MKKWLFAILMFFSVNAFAQDSTKVYNLQLQASTIEVLVNQLTNYDNDALFQVYLDLRPKFRVSNPPSGSTLVTIDSIHTVDLAGIYNYLLNSADGLNLSNALGNQIQAARNANSYLNRLCNDYEMYWSDMKAAMRQYGRKLLRGK